MLHRHFVVRDTLRVRLWTQSTVQTCATSNHRKI